jgi:hypothetical protein
MFDREANVGSSRMGAFAERGHNVPELTIQLAEVAEWT